MLSYVCLINSRLNFKTPFCANALSITAALSLHSVTRIERSSLCTIRYHAADSVSSDYLKQAVPIFAGSKISDHEQV